MRKPRPLLASWSWSYQQQKNLQRGGGKGGSLLAQPKHNSWLLSEAVFCLVRLQGGISRMQLDTQRLGKPFQLSRYVPRLPQTILLGHKLQPQALLLLVHCDSTPHLNCWMRCAPFVRYIS